ncbi:MAG TPA: SUF system NifU family Fe-S cluster assembly protein [Anaeromyxobacteraceae bacterium]|nr:SUF system NifU family Fe-S cluster assembly protein [Anaeromyxobacteraceae bacterium]
MSAELDDLYQEVILDHGRRPRNFRALPDATARAEGLNPLCGDHYTVYVKLEGDRIADVSFQGAGCAISKASASLMTSALKGKTVAEAEDTFRRFQAMVVEGDPAQASTLGKLAVLKGVCDFPTRVKCASLVWHTLHNALAGEQRPASTE